jgi:hypothetical protein
VPERNFLGAYLDGVDDNRNAVFVELITQNQRNCLVISKVIFYPHSEAAPSGYKLIIPFMG